MVCLFCGEIVGKVLSQCDPPRPRRQGGHTSSTYSKRRQTKRGTTNEQKH